MILEIMEPLTLFYIVCKLLLVSIWVEIGHFGVFEILEFLFNFYNHDAYFVHFFICYKDFEMTLKHTPYDTKWNFLNAKGFISKSHFEVIITQKKIFKKREVSS